MATFLLAVAAHAAGIDETDDHSETKGGNVFRHGPLRLQVEKPGEWFFQIRPEEVELSKGEPLGALEIEQQTARLAQRPLLMITHNESPQTFVQALPFAQLGVRAVMIHRGDALAAARMIFSEERHETPEYGLLTAPAAIDAEGDGITAARFSYRFRLEEAGSVSFPVVDLILVKRGNVLYELRLFSTADERQQHHDAFETIAGSLRFDPVEDAE